MSELPKRDTPYDVAIIGGGISGTALLYLLGKYTDLKALCLIEKYADIATVNSHGKNNSQTLHCGDIETNYTLEKAVQVKATADMVLKYCESLPNHDEILFPYNKMVLGVGEQECRFLRERFKTFGPHFPGMQLLERDRIAELEPALTIERKPDEEIVALGVLGDKTAVNYQKLAESFVEQSRQIGDKSIDLLMSTQAKTFEETDKGYRIKTNRGDIEARFVVVSAGGHSLLYAQKMGYGLHYSCLPVAGSFYFAPQTLRGKVYTIQDEKLPFAAIHGDPDVLEQGKTRFGPTALILPMLERYNWKTIPEYLKVLHLDRKVFAVFWDLFKVREIRRYIFKNFLFELPLIRRWLFTRDVRKIVPSVQMRDIRFAHHFGGVRPVMIDKQNRKLHLGEAQINTGKGIIFNMTPSPGATSCLGNGEKDLRIIVDYLKCGFDEAALDRDLKAQ